MTSQNSLDRAAAVLLSWAKDLPNIYFVTDKDNKDKRFLNLSKGREGVFKPTDYRSNTEKQIELVKHLYYNCEPTEWYLLADDDTYIYIDNLIELLKDKTSNDPVYAGKMINFCAWDHNLIYASGGAGFILNRKALKLLAEQWQIIPYAESHIIDNLYADVAQGFALRERGVKPTQCYYFCSEFFSKKNNLQGILPKAKEQELLYSRKILFWFFNKIISYHRITPQYMIGINWKNLETPMNLQTKNNIEINISNKLHKEWTNLQNELK